MQRSSRFWWALALLPAASPPRAPQGDALDRVRWPAGAWEQRRGDRVTVERGMPPRGGVALGESRTVVRHTVRAYEHLRRG